MSIEKTIKKLRLKFKDEIDCCKDCGDFCEDKKGCQSLDVQKDILKSYNKSILKILAFVEKEYVRKEKVVEDIKNIAWLIDNAPLNTIKENIVAIHDKYKLEG
jgi:hypothetical protein